MTTLVKLYVGGYNNIIPSNQKELYGDFVVSEASLSRAINEAGSFDFSIPVALLRGQSLKLNGIWFLTQTTQNIYSAELYQNGEMLMEGNVDSIGLNYVDEEPTLKFSCNGELADLIRYKAREDAYYQDEYLLYILTHLFRPEFGSSLVSNWFYGDVLTLEDMLIKTTIDLRGETRLFSQITKVLNAFPNTFFRYGGHVASPLYPYTSHYHLDIGAFNTKRYPPISAESITQLSQDVKYSGVLRRIQSFGGEIEVAGVKRRIDLQDAIAYDPVGLGGIITVSGLANNNILSGYGEEIIVYYDEIVPSVKVDPTVTEINQAGYALYLKSNAELIQKSTFQMNWQATVKTLPSDFKVGDQLFLRGSARQVFYDRHSGKSLYVDLGTIEQWYRVNGYSQKIKDDDVSYSLDLTTNIRLQQKNDPILDLYDSISQPTKAEDSVYVNQGWVYRVLSATVPVGTEGDSFQGEPGDYYPAALAIIPLEAYPPGTVEAVLLKAPFSYEDGVTISVNENPSLAIPPTGLQVLVSLNNNWTVDDSVTIYALVLYKP